MCDQLGHRSPASSNRRRRGATAIRLTEVTGQRRAIDRTQERFGLWQDLLIGDAGYDDARNLS